LTNNHRLNLFKLPGIVRADGAEEAAEAAAQADDERKQAELDVARAEEAVAAGVPGAEEQLEAAEERLERALDAVLNAEMDEDAMDGEGEDDFDDFDEKEEEDGDEEEEEEEGEKVTNEKRNRGRKDKTDEVDEGVRKQKETPLNFSLVDTTKPNEERAKLWPLYDDAVALECEVKAGEMLFLPVSNSLFEGPRFLCSPLTHALPCLLQAGWFHNVTSFSDSSSTPGTYHMAFNYWFHPPDTQDYATPYRSTFWEVDWKARGL